MSRFKFFKFIGQYISLGTFRKVLDFFDHYIGGIVRRTDKHHIFLSGAGIAFSLILSLIPFILLVFAILGSVINPETVETQLTHAIDTIIPYPEYAKFTREAILRRIPAVIEYKTIAGYIGALGLLFTASWLFSSIRTVLNNVYGLEENKGALHGLLRDFGMVLLLVVFVLLSTIVFPTINVLFKAAEKVEFLGSFRISQFTDSILSLVSILIIFIMFFIFYKLIPYAKLGKRIPLVSAFWATALWEAARRLFGYYVYDFLSQNRVYGPFILVVVVLFWLFYSSCLFILAAEIGQLYRERLHKKGKIFL